MSDLSSVIIPVAVAVILSVGASLGVSRFSGPAMSAVQTRLAVVTQERDDALARIARFEARIAQLEGHVAELQAAAITKDREIAALYRRIDDAERRR